MQARFAIQSLPSDPVNEIAHHFKNFAPLGRHRASRRDIRYKQTEPCGESPVDYGPGLIAIPLQGFDLPVKDSLHFTAKPLTQIPQVLPGQGSELLAVRCGELWPDIYRPGGAWTTRRCMEKWCDLTTQDRWDELPTPVSSSRNIPHPSDRNRTGGTRHA